MAGAYILIIIVGQYWHGIATTTAVFDDRLSCEKASLELRKDVDDYTQQNLVTICVQKGKEP